MSLRPPFAHKPWLVLLLLSPSLAFAADNAEKTPTQFDTVTVTATRTEQKLDEVPSTVSVITEREVDQNNVKNIKDLIRYEPGVSVSGSGSRFGLSGFTIRGIGGNRVLTQVDGVSVPDAFDFGPYMDSRRDFIDPDIMKQVEIIRGPASSLYGSDAIGGAVSFLTKNAADYLEDGDDAYARLKTGYDGSDDSWMRSATVAGRLGSVDGVVHIGRRDGQAVDSYSSRGGIGSTRGEANPQEYTAENLLLKGGWNYHDNDRLQFTYERYAVDTDTQVLSEYSNTAAIRTTDASDSTDRARYSLQHTFALNSLLVDNVDWHLDYQDSESRQRTYMGRFASSTFRDRYRDSTYEEKLWALNAKLDKAFATGAVNHQLIYGFDVKRLENRDRRDGGEVFRATGAAVPVTPGGDIFPNSDFPDPTSKEYALFAQDEMTIGRWTLLPGLRYDRFEMKPHVTQQYMNSGATDANPKSTKDEALSPKLGLTFQIDDAHSLYGQYAAGFRAPKAVEMFGEFTNSSFGYRTIANTKLKSETSDSYEFGLRGKYSVGTFGTALFYNRYKDFIEREERVSVAPPLTTDFQYVNKDRVTIRGAEAKGELFLDQLGVMPSGWKAMGSIAYARGKDEGTGQPINSVDPLKAVFGLGYAEPNGKFGGSLNWTVVAAKERVNDGATTQGGVPNQYEPSGYGVVDLNGWWQVTEEFSVNAGLFNLGDKEYWQWGDVRGQTSLTTGIDRYSQPGRHAAVNFIWEI